MGIDQKQHANEKQKDSQSLMEMLPYDETKGGVKRAPLAIKMAFDIWQAKVSNQTCRSATKRNVWSDTIFASFPGDWAQS